MAVRKTPNNNKIEFLKFDAAKIPAAYESKERDENTFVKYGMDNRYPEYLLKLFNQCPSHASIINSKTNYITMDGLKFVNGDFVKLRVNAVDTFDEFINKLIKDYLLFNYFAVEVIYNSFNQPIEYHFVPAQHIRTNKSKTKFWVTDDWSSSSKAIVFDRWKPVATNSTSKIYFFDGYNPSNNLVYPTPEYSGCITALENDIAIREFNLNNIKNQFSVSTIITFFRGSNVAPEIKELAIRALKDSHTGANGKKLIVDFQDPNHPSADVKNISPGDWDKAYELIGKSVKDDIIQGHQITSPILFGSKTEGQLGGATELQTSYEIFQATYGRFKRNELILAFNELFTGSELVKGELEFASVPPLYSNAISDSMKEKIYTINEIRADAGLKPLVNGDRLLSDVEINPPAKVQVVQSAQVEKNFHLSEEDFEKIRDLGETIEEFDFIQEGEDVKTEEDFKRVELKFETIDEIADYILENEVDGQSIKDLKSALRKDLGINVSVSDLRGMLNDLSKAGVIKVSIDGDAIKVEKNPTAEPTKRIEVRYSYDVRPGLGAPIIPTTRPFCRKLVENNRFYKIEEVQRMQEIFGYDIMKFGGGYYTDANGVTQTHCRHYFKAMTVTKKNK